MSGGDKSSLAPLITRLIGGNMLVAGTGDQWLQGGDTMVVGDCNDTVIVRMKGRRRRYGDPTLEVINDNTWRQVA